MPIGTPTGLGNSNASGSSPSVTTSGSAPSSSLIIAFVSWVVGGTNQTLSSVSGGGLTWAVDHNQQFAGAANWGYAIASAQAPSGLATSTAITGTMSGVITSNMMAVVYCTGLETTGVKDVSDGNGETTGTTWDTTATSTTVADTLVIGGSIVDSQTTNTPTNSASEIYDFQRTADAISMCVEYKILSAIGSASLTGDWSGASGADKTSAFVAYKGLAAAGGGTSGGGGGVARPGRHRGRFPGREPGWF